MLVAVKQTVRFERAANLAEINSSCTGSNGMGLKR
jgi:hypothetical protein